ncbi:MAG TPA: helix-turn-helix domain-containing protein [Pyrinomonadaceae bacterium]|nr:helix-turn-helix domain-containing protein [Pyrinomonadaceae bacterium]
MTSTNTEMQKLAYSVEEIATQTSLSKAFLRNEIRAGRLKVNHFGRRVVVLSEDLQKYLRKQSDQNEVNN